MIRPERIGVEPHGAPGDNRLPGMVERAVFLGGSYEIHVRVLGGEILKVDDGQRGNPATFGLEQGTPVTLYLPPDALRVLRPDPEPGAGRRRGRDRACRRRLDGARAERGRRCSAAGATAPSM